VAERRARTRRSERDSSRAGCCRRLSRGRPTRLVRTKSGPRLAAMCQAGRLQRHRRLGPLPALRKPWAHALPLRAPRCVRPADDDRSSIASTPAPTIAPPAVPMIRTTPPWSSPQPPSLAAIAITAPAAAAPITAPTAAPFVTGSSVALCPLVSESRARSRLPCLRSHSLTLAAGRLAARATAASQLAESRTSDNAISPSSRSRQLKP
jgi:hypothetical protein